MRAGLPRPGDEASRLGEGRTAGVRPGQAKALEFELQGEAGVAGTRASGFAVLRPGSFH